MIRAVVHTVPPAALARAAVAAALASTSLGVGAAGDPVAGQNVYRANCAVCHSASAGANVNGILNGAGQPSYIAAAFGRVPAMSFLPTVLSARDIEDVAAYLLLFRPGGGTNPSLGTVSVVEFYNVSLDHYFVSSLQPDIDALDSGRLPGWTRTGRSFKAYTSAADAPPGASPVCRFYIPPAQGDSHFYSASPTECDDVRRKFPTFSFESAAVMYVQVPDATTGACPAGTVPVYRVWNARVDSNHRYTTDLVVRDQMVARGHVAEGAGPLGVVMCAAQ